MTHNTKRAAWVGPLALVSGIVCALAAPAGAAAGPTANYKARALVVATDATTATVCVGSAKKSTNKPGSVWRSLPVVFDLSSAKLNVRDVDGDGVGDIADL